MDAASAAECWAHLNKSCQYCRAKLVQEDTHRQLIPEKRTEKLQTCELQKQYKKIQSPFVLRLQPINSLRFSSSFEDLPRWICVNCLYRFQAPESTRSANSAPVAPAAGGHIPVSFVPMRPGTSWNVNFIRQIRIMRKLSHLFPPTISAKNNKLIQNTYCMYIIIYKYTEDAHVQRK